MSDKRWRIKTARGYYYSTPNGKYGRPNGSKLEAWVLCDTHMLEAMTMFAQPAFAELEAVAERYPGHTPCMRCKVNGKRR